MSEPRCEALFATKKCSHCHGTGSIALKGANQGHFARCVHCGGKGQIELNYKDVYLNHNDSALFYATADKEKIARRENRQNLLILLLVDLVYICVFGFFFVGEYAYSEVWNYVNDLDYFTKLELVALISFIFAQPMKWQWNKLSSGAEKLQVCEQEKSRICVLYGVESGEICEVHHPDEKGV